MNLNEQILVLDHGYIKYITHCGSDESIIEAARMSTDNGFQGWDKDEALLEYLYSHFHSTPFEMPDLTIEVQAPIMVFREWHRHRTQSYNELSARYTELPDMYYLPSIERIQKQSKLNKQGSDEPFDEATATDIQHQIRNMQRSIRDQYDYLIKSGLAREIARINCPVAQYSRMHAKGNLLNWLKFSTLRMAPGAQWEIRQYAKALALIIKELYPRTYALFEEYSLNGAHFGNRERKLMARLLEKLNTEEIKDLTYSEFGVGSRKSKEFMDKIGVTLA